MKTGTLVAVGVGAPAISYVLADANSFGSLLAPPVTMLAGLAGAIVGSAFKKAPVGFVVGNVAMVLYLLFQSTEFARDKS